MKNRIKNIKWEKGFLRIWAVCSFFWVLLTFWVTFEDGGTIYDFEFLSIAFGWPIGILVFAYVSKFLIKFIINGFK